MSIWQLHHLVLLALSSRSGYAALQGQDESDETRDTLESCSAIGGAIEFTSVKIDAIKVLPH